MRSFDFRSNFLVSISLLINIGKEMSLPGFRTTESRHFGLLFLDHKDKIFGTPARNLKLGSKTVITSHLYGCPLCITFVLL